MTGPEACEFKIFLNCRDVDWAENNQGLTTFHVLSWTSRVLVLAWRCSKVFMNEGNDFHKLHAVMQQLEPVKEAVSTLATSLSLQGDVLMTILDKSLPTASGLAGEFMTLTLPLSHASRRHFCALHAADEDCCIAAL